MGVSLTEQGVVTPEGEIPAGLADWLMEIDTTVARARKELAERK